MKCIAFNRRGTLLAAGCNDGSCVIWDFETRGIAKVLRDDECSSPITSICWSKYGHRILVSAADKSLILWDVMSGKKITRIVLQQTPLQARLHPGSSTPSICLACPLSCAPIIVDLNTGNTTLLKVSVSETCNGPAAPSRNKSSDGITSYTPTAACFNKYGTLVYVGNSKGEILVIDYKNGEVRAIVPISGGSVAVGSKCLILFREFQDSITKVHWKAPCFSGDDYTENWSAFAPDFKELEENEEYVEREDEFDLIPETEKVKVPDVNEDEEVDIIAVEKDATFSDSDMSQEELCFLPATPTRDAPEQQEKGVETSSKLLDTNNTGSPLSEEAGPNGHITNHASSPLEDDAGRMKRKRKPSEKVLELQAEKVKKPSKSSKLAKPKSKSLVDQDNGNGFHGDGLYDE
uniref:Retinoblastoma-binding protein 5 n=1 Tax=Cajanus cajan TaxID=3821 RepID=A0A151SJQ5_CAJCA|nr:Retinoblastoma-binding protein 5 [Cajanus cajan]